MKFVRKLTEQNWLYFDENGVEYVEVGEGNFMPKADYDHAATFPPSRGKGILVGPLTTKEDYDAQMGGYNGPSFEQAKSLIRPNVGIKSVVMGGYTRQEIAKAGFPNVIVPVIQKQ